MTSQTHPSRPSRFSTFKAIILCLLAGLFSTAFAEDWDGSTSKPSSKEIDGVEYYVITSPSELAWFAYQVNEKGENKINAILGNDIHFMDDTTLTSSLSFPTIGDSLNVFSGVFDGKNFAIYGMNGSYLIYTSNSEVRNITFRNVKLTSVVRVNKGSMNKINLFGKLSYGVAEFNDGDITNCSNHGTGKIAYNNKGNIGFCVNTKGGVVVVNSGLISNSKGNINSSSAFGTSKWGGIANENSGTIEACEANVSIGRMEYNYSTRTECTYVENGVAKTGYMYTTNGTGNLGGIVGKNLSTGTILQSSAFFSIDTILGVARAKVPAPRSCSYFPNSNVNVYIGGVAGDNQGKIKASSSYLKIDVLNSSDDSGPYYYFGGIAGRSIGTTSKEAVIEQSFSYMSLERYLPSSYNNGHFLFGAASAFNEKGLISDSHVELSMPHFPNIKNSSIQVGAICARNSDRVRNVYGVIEIVGEKLLADEKYFAGIIHLNGKAGEVYNVYYDKDVLNDDSIGVFYNNESGTVLNVVGKTTAVMQSPAFVETLNTNAGLDDDSGLWQYCEGHYPILASEGTCEEFYSKYGLSSSSQSSSSGAESSSSSAPVVSSSSATESSSSQTPASSSSSDIILSSSDESSSSSMVASSSSGESSSSVKPESSSNEAKSSSSSKANSSSSRGTDVVRNTVQPTFNLAVNGMTLTLSNTQGGMVRIFDALGHLVVAKPLSATGATAITMQTPGRYIVRLNGASEVVTLK
ncbi:MAG: T9SS type A sorting domain-containing protein [Fibrobacter sp.]|uniref:T9SS type A sorting domain-containing protein n=1 Tax=Fibrobacter sp. TaxID=35828 RepID=UPI002A912187|nr:T9SS type A sorting domain-containing protein [Fibrobacter sp.]MDY6263486.1 T9SS type A sorting domain-containing protein [Fibrobacter sp.]